MITGPGNSLLATETSNPERLKQGSLYQPVSIFFQQVKVESIKVGTFTHLFNPTIGILI